MHDDNHGTEHAIKYFALDDNAIYVSTAYDFHPHNELVGPARDAAIDQLLDHIDFARIARAVNRRGYAVDVTESDPDDEPAVHDPRDYSLELLDCLLDTCRAASSERPHPTVWLMDLLWAARDRWVAAHP